MRRAKTLALSFAALFALVLAALTLGVSSASAGFFTQTLYAGQTQVAGHVDVTTTSKTISVLFVLEPGYVLTQAHVDVEANLADIPAKNGNPIPGLFALQGTTPGPYVFTGLTAGTTYYVAAHAVVWNGLETVNVVSNTNTDVTNFSGAAVAHKAVAANEPFTYPDCNTYSPSDVVPSLWDNGIGSTAFNAFSGAGADWVWNTLNPMNPILGEYATFQNTFTVGGLLTGTPTLMVTADNGYTASVNGSFVGKAQLGPGFPGTLMETVVPGSPQTGDWGVASQGWQTVESYPVSLKTGQNTLSVTAADEYMWNGLDYLGPDFYFADYNPVGGAVVPDPAPGMGSVDGSTCTNPGYNPGAVIYKLTYDHYTTSNTAWGAGTAFPGKNWATYMTVTTDA